MYKPKSPADAKEYIADKLCDDTLLGRSGYKMYESKYVVPYNPAEASNYKEVIHELMNDLPGRGVIPAEVNLYDIVLDYLDEQGLWEVFKEREGELDTQTLIETLQATVTIEGVIIPRVEQQLEDAGNYDIAFITGVGEVYPFVRTHHILDELETDKPLVLWFPGEFERKPDGRTVMNVLSVNADQGGYYRATNVYDL
jgi:hypothetical protein